MEAVYANLQGISPKHFGINDFLLLNSESPFMQYIDSDCINLTLAASRDENVSVESLKEEMKKRCQTPPFQKAIDLLKSMEKLSSPIDKINLLDKCNNQIALCIREFWKDVRVPESKILTAIDEFLSIYLYVLTQARV